VRLRHDGTEDDLEAFYRSYLQLCNDHRFDELHRFVADDVQVNGVVQGRAGYIAGLKAVIAEFPDYRWRLQQLLIQDVWLSAHFIDTGTPPGTPGPASVSPRPVIRQEFAFYRIEGSQIREVWVAAVDLEAPSPSSQDG
jgi:predicted ester cyclase